MSNEFIDFDNELSLEKLEIRLEMVAAEGGCCERKCSGGDGQDGGTGGNGPTVPIPKPTDTVPTEA